MGGAFLGLADDSTAAEFNPAGIRILPRSEFAWQLTRTYDRRDEYLPFTSNDRGEATFEEDTNQWTTPSFASFVYPTEKLTIAVSQLTTINLVHHFDDPTPDFAGRRYESKTEARNNAYGLTFAFDLRERLHMGVTLRMNRFDFENRDSRRVPVAELTDWSPSFNVGLLWRATQKWSFGSVFKSSQKVEGEILGSDVSTELPQTVGVGVAYHPNDKIRLLADVDRIGWSDFDGAPDDDYVRNDVTRFHLGGEYLLCANKDIAWFLRGGYMREDSNSLYYAGADEFARAMTPEKDDIDHLTFGIGLAKEKYQLDLGVDHELDGATTFILAMIHYF
jgi:long-subunit fatty acid transport protein